jgi:aromatic ring-opening dioxygenase catalytic subunit (LigB family)
LASAGFESATDEKRGYDHGTFVPLKVAYPQADVPVVQLSLVSGLDPELHLRLGRALAPLRDEGVFIIGSGMTYHDLRALRTGEAGPVSRVFDAWLRESVTLESTERDARLRDWTRAPAARRAHPREEHLIPLMVAAGAAGADRGTVAFHGQMYGVELSGYHFAE